jgi:hypothetical protein
MMNTYSKTKMKESQEKFKSQGQLKNLGFNSIQTHL